VKRVHSLIRGILGVRSGYHESASDEDTLILFQYVAPQAIVMETAFLAQNIWSAHAQAQDLHHCLTMTTSKYCLWRTLPLRFRSRLNALYCGVQAPLNPLADIARHLAEELSGEEIADMAGVFGTPEAIRSLCKAAGFSNVEALLCISL